MSDLGPQSFLYFLENTPQDGVIETLFVVLEIVVLRLIFAFSALTLFVGRQKEHPDCKIE